MSLVAPIVAGIAGGTGLTLVVANLLPSPPPELRSAVERCIATACPRPSTSTLRNSTRIVPAVSEKSLPYMSVIASRPLKSPESGWDPGTWCVQSPVIIPRRESMSPREKAS